MEYFFSSKLYQSRAPFSHFVHNETQGYISGIVGQDPDDGALVSQNFKEQCEQMFKNLMILFEEIGIRPDQVLKLTVYLTSFDEFEVLNEIQKEYFTDSNPARSCIGVSSLPLGAKIQIDAIVSLR